MHRNNTLLIVDDEPSILDTYRHALAPAPVVTIVSSRRARAPEVAAAALPEYRLLLASTGEDAVRIVEEEVAAGRRIAGGFFDVRMPGGIDGIETIRRIRELDGDVRCTIVTAYQDRSVEDINRLFAGDHEDEWDYVVKPFTEAEIRQKARQMVSAWNRTRREETQRKDLKRLVEYISQIRDLGKRDLFSVIEYVLERLADFTDSSGGFVVSIEPEIQFRAGVGSTATPEAANRLIAEAQLADAIRTTVRSGDTNQSHEVCVVPILCVAARGVAVLLTGQPLSEQRRALVRIFAENASVAIQNHTLYGEIVQLNADLEGKVAERTSDLTRANLALHEQAQHLETALVTLKDTERQLVLREKLSVVGQLAASVAHEINNPCAFVLSNLHLLDKLAKKLPEYIQLIDSGATPEALRLWRASARVDDIIQDLPGIATDCVDGVRRIAAIAADLKSFARADEDAMEAVTVESLLDKTLRILDAELRHHVIVSRDFASTPAIAGNPGRLLQVFLNLIHNAAQAMTSTNPDDNRLVVATKVHGDQVEVVISDTGCGIPAEKLETIFEPFFTTKPTGVGTGLGLSITKTIVQQHQGTVHAESELGRGSRFVIRLPAREAPARVAQPSANPIGMRRLRVLLVDDDPHVLRGFQRLLGGRHDVCAAASGREALDILAKEAPFDAVLCDVMMPGMTGVDLYRQVAALHAGLAARVVFVTGGALTPVLEEFVSAPNRRLLRKPVDPVDLELVVQEVVAAARPAA